MDEEKLRDLIQSSIEIASEWEEDYLDEDIEVETFEQALLLTNDKGLVVRVNDSEFIVTVKRSR